MKTDAERARTRELYQLNKAAIRARRAQLHAALSPEEKQRRLARQRELYALNKDAPWRVRQRERDAARAKGRQPAPPPEPVKVLPPPCYRSEAEVSVLLARQRYALVRLISAARGAQMIADMLSVAPSTKAKPAPRVYAAVEELVSALFPRVIPRQEQRS